VIGDVEGAGYPVRNTAAAATSAASDGEKLDFDTEN
jgi:hypothetical protein